jgi:hypothetical protein
LIVGVLFAQGEFVPCWKPVKADRSSLSTYYDCYNPECIKIFDPASEVKRAGATAGSLETAGKVMLPLGLVFIVLLGAVVVGMIKTDSLD